MSATGIGAFENDGAQDLCYDLRQAGLDSALDVLRSSWKTVVELAADEYLEKDYAESAVAAAAIVVAKMTHDAEILELNGVNEVIPEIGEDMPNMAISALRRILGDNSELYELWIDSGRGDAWQEGVEAIIASLRADA